MQLSNFGRNIRFEPANFFVPRDEAEVLEILRRYRGQAIREVGRLHSWSEAPEGRGIVLDLRYLDSVRLEERDGETRAVVGAGIQHKALVEFAQPARLYPAVAGLDHGTEHRRGHGYRYT